MRDELDAGPFSSAVSNTKRLALSGLAGAGLLMIPIAMLEDAGQTGLPKDVLVPLVLATLTVLGGVSTRTYQAGAVSALLVLTAALGPAPLVQAAIVPMSGALEQMTTVMSQSLDAQVVRGAWWGAFVLAALTSWLSRRPE